jgi:hypothetical protein
MTITDGNYHVTIHGVLTRFDLKRLERMCGPAFEWRELPLRIHLADSIVLDQYALFFLSCLSSRDAVVTGPGGANAAQSTDNSRIQRGRSEHP